MGSSDGNNSSCVAGRSPVRRYVDLIDSKKLGRTYLKWKGADSYEPSHPLPCWCWWAHPKYQQTDPKHPPPVFPFVIGTRSFWLILAFSYWLTGIAAKIYVEQLDSYVETYHSGGRSIVATPRSGQHCPRVATLVTEVVVDLTERTLYSGRNDPFGRMFLSLPTMEVLENHRDPTQRSVSMAAIHIRLGGAWMIGRTHRVVSMKIERHNLGSSTMLVEIHSY